MARIRTAASGFTPPLAASGRARSTTAMAAAASISTTRRPPDGTDHPALRPRPSRRMSLNPSSPPKRGSGGKLDDLCLTEPAGVRSYWLPHKASEAAMAKYMLVSFKTCPWVQRSAIVFREKNIEFEFRHIEPDNRPDWFLAISPHKKVPAMTVDERCRCSSQTRSTSISTRRSRPGSIPRSDRAGDQPCLDRICADLRQHRHGDRLCRHRGRLQQGGRSRSRWRSSGSKRHSKSRAAVPSSTVPNIRSSMPPMRPSCSAISSWTG